jgi:hypothetical protein
MRNETKLLEELGKSKKNKRIEVKMYRWKVEIRGYIQEN